MVPGAHPFGEWFERERNILKGRYVSIALTNKKNSKAQKCLMPKALYARVF
jgi:hypothetical protein